MSDGIDSTPWAYIAAWIVAAVGVVAGVLAIAGHFASPPPSWLTPDIIGTAAIVAPIAAGLAALLPSVTRTPSAREESYLHATVGVLPADLAHKFPSVGEPRPGGPAPH